jgi:hypothetical protein
MISAKERNTAGTEHNSRIDDKISRNLPSFIACGSSQKDKFIIAQTVIMTNGCSIR